MTAKQLLLLIIVPIVVSILANLLTDPIKRLLAVASGRVRQRYERREADRQELVDALVARDGLATQYLVVMWGGVLTLGIITIVSVSLGALYDLLLRGTAPAFNFFNIGGTVAGYFALRFSHTLTKNYRDYLNRTDVPEPLVRAIMGDLRRSKGSA